MKHKLPFYIFKYHCFSIHFPPYLTGRKNQRPVCYSQNDIYILISTIVTKHITLRPCFCYCPYFLRLPLIPFSISFIHLQIQTYHSNATWYKSLLNRVFIFSIFSFNISIRIQLLFLFKAATPTAPISSCQP